MTLKKLEEIISLKEKEGYYKHLEIETGKFLYCKEEEQDIFLDFINKNWENSELTYMTFEKEFLKGIVEIFEKEKRTTDEENNPAKEIKKNIEKIFPKKEFNVYDEIMGIYVKDKGTFEDFTIYNVEKNRDNLEEKIKMMIKTKEESKISELNEGIPEFIIETKVKAREIDMAFVLADEKNKNFVSLLQIENFKGTRVLTHPLKISIGRKIRNNNIERIAKGKGEGKYISQTLVEEYIEYKDYKKDKQLENLWKIISKDNLNDLEKLIINSINWLGEAIQDVTLGISIIKAMIFLEATIKKENEGGIKEVIAKRTATIIESKYKNVNNVYKDMRRFYKIRSEVNHTGKVQINNIDKIKLILYAKEVLIQLTTNIDYTGILNQKYLVDKLKKQSVLHIFSK